MALAETTVRRGPRAEAEREPHADLEDALRAVLDPELDEDLVSLGFVADLRRDGGHVTVGLRLPTYWCSPNFSWLMATDARSALLSVPGVEEVTVQLRDHHASEEISAGVSEGRSFADALGPEADGGGLDDLRLLFRRKALLVRQERLLRVLEADGAQVEPGLTLGELPDSAAARAYLDVRAELGLDCSDGALVLSDAAGRPVPDLTAHRRRTRMAAVSQRGNDAMCRGLLRTRYGEETAP